MRYTRQNRILELIQQYDIETQQQLTDFLKAEGFEVTQATVSRDIKKLMLVKERKNGKSCYSAPKAAEHPHEKFAKLMKDTIQSIEASENIIVIKTLNGCAGPAAEAIDIQNSELILGTIAGDNTIFIVASSKEVIPVVIENLKRFFEK